MNQNFDILLFLVRRASATSPPQSPGYQREYEEGTCITYLKNYLPFTNADEILKIELSPFSNLKF